MNILCYPNNNSYHIHTHHRHKTLHSNHNRTKQLLLRKPFTVFCKSSSDDFVKRVLEENPSQVPTKYLIGNKLYTSREKENLGKKSNEGIFDLLKRLSLKNSQRKSESDDEVSGERDSVYLNDLVKDYKGKLYVPEQIFATPLSEEEEFNENLKKLPKMSIEDFTKALSKDKIKLVTSKETLKEDYGIGYKDYIVDLKEIPGDKRLQVTKWVLRVDSIEAQAILDEYSGPRYEIESRRITSWVGIMSEYPHPVASSISSRVVAELGAVTVVVGLAAILVGGFLSAAVFVVTSFIFVATVYVAWPIAQPILKFFLRVAGSMLERVWDKIVDFFLDGGFLSKIYELCTVAGLASSAQTLAVTLPIVVGMVLLVRFTLSRKPKNFRKWDLWQGMNFSLSKAEARVDGSTGIRFSDVAGIDDAVDELQELVRYLKNPELFDKMGIKPPHGVLLEGPPGCGKTLVAKAIAGEAGVPFYQMAGSEFVEFLVGVGSARIRDLFKRAKVNKPSVVFIDEIDALATRRQGTFNESTDNLYNAATQERETTLNQLLIELDGFDTGKGIIFLAATNRRDLLDPALLRPGRLDRKIKILPPNAKGRLDILKIHANKVKISDSVDLSSYAQNLPGWSGARLAQLVQEAALVAVRKRHNSILQSDMDEAVDRLTVGPKRMGVDLGYQGQCRRATTEVGVAITSHLLRRYENAKVEYCERISIVPRGQTFSQLVFRRLDDESYMFERRPQLLHRLQVMLGGRAAEEVIYGRDTSKASVEYLAHASWLARKILTIWNLEDPMVIHGEAPPWRKSFKFVGPRLDFEGALYDHYDLIEPPLNFNLEAQVAQRTEELIRDMYRKTVSRLREHHAALLETIKVLLNQREVSGEEIDFILNKYPPQTPLHLLEKEIPGNLPLMKEQRHDLEYTIQTQTKEETA
ncbi:probable inactive ATP-dependent zinc metalloprotease FTSHI 1, chloroplastic [Trifolium pratense]|uniref:probable inactive ATP-dependent zinc metalloprotease FTSHI 1, chloroplastic n=1 Tax=Trifolium pratense TaxID=57577 RepID=UPI001E697B7A|nr:probable inactive ATP-dependent zinc metalloprotease FTSHI 1, chloroplastic [Trifolium pratense]